jgi:catechol 2,3-dioxygenase
MRSPFRFFTLSFKAEAPRERDTMSSAADESSRSELHPAVRIGHVHLRVGDLERATAFYRDVLGFDVTVYRRHYAFLSAGGYHHHIGLNTWHSEGGTPPPEGHTGLLHFAILYPDRRELARAVERLLEHGYPIREAEDHGCRSQCTLATPTATALSSPTTARERSGSTREATRTSRPNRSILATYWWSRAPRLSPYSAECVEEKFSEVRGSKRLLYAASIPRQ